MYSSPVDLLRNISINSYPSGQNGDMFKRIFLIQNSWMSNKFPLKHVPWGLINNMSGLAQIMALRHPGDKPLCDKVFQCIKDIYDGCKASINLNGHLTDAFATEYGVKQGDCLSPILFSLFINDMANEIKSNCNGVSLGNFDVHCLLYADDLVLLAETKDDLQCMLDTVFLWCRKWHMKINPPKI